MNNRRHSQVIPSAGRGRGLRRMNTDRGPHRKPSTGSAGRNGQQQQLGGSTLMVPTKKEDSRRRNGGLDASHRSAQSDCFQTEREDTRRRSTIKYMKKRSSSCDNMADMFADPETGNGMGERKSSADNLAEMIALSRQSLSISSGNAGAMNLRRSGGEDKLSRRNTYRGPPPTQSIRESVKPRRNTCTSRERVMGGSTMKVLTKKDDDHRGSYNKNRSDRSVDNSIKSDGYIPELERSIKRKSIKKSRRISSHSYGSMSDYDFDTSDDDSSENLAEMIVLSRQKASQPSQKKGGRDGRRNTVSYKGPPRSQPNAAEKEPMNVSMPQLKHRGSVAAKRTSHLGKSTQMVLTKKEDDSRSRSTRPTGDLDRSDRSARSDGYVHEDPSNVKERKFLTRKRSSSLDNLSEMAGAMNPPVSNEMIQSKTRAARLRRDPSDSDNSLYDTVLMDLFSSIAATSQEKGFKHQDISSEDSELDGEFSRQNSSYDLTPIHNIPVAPPIGANNFIDQSQIPSKPPLTNEPKQKPQHPRGSSDVAASARQRLLDQSIKSTNMEKEGEAIRNKTAAAPMQKRQTDQPLKNSNREKGEAKVAPPRRNHDNISEMATHKHATPLAQDVSPKQATNPQHLKLYDELSSVSQDPKIGKWIDLQQGQDGTTSTEPDASYLLMRSVGGGCHQGFLPYQMDKNRGRSRCRPCTRVLVVTLLVLLTGIGIGGYFWFFHSGFSGSNEEEPSKVHETNNATNATGELDEETSEPPAPSNDTLIASPPSDIEARCSPSNLPGSLSACLSACLPSACCYEGFTGDTCLENPGCSSYKPYCDAFYDAWIGSTEGVLRAPTDEMVNMCTGTKDILVNEETPLPDSSSFSVKRLRGQGNPDQSVDSHNFTSTNLLTPSTQETCLQYCISAKCCSAPVITDLGGTGLVLSTTGVYTDAASGDYVMTNCQESNSKNKELCSQYDAFCSSDQVTEQGLSNIGSSSSPSTLASVSSTNGTLPDVSAPVISPSRSPAPNGYQSSMGPAAGYPVLSNQPTQNVNSVGNQTSPESLVNTSLTLTEDSLPSVTASLSPSQTPELPQHTQTPNITTNVSSPVIIPPPSALNIQSACATDEAAFLIATGDPQAFSKCAAACQDGICCFAAQLGDESIDDCYYENEQVCTEYSPCLVLLDFVGNGPNSNNVTVDDTTAELNNAANESTSDLQESPEDNTAPVNLTDPVLIEGPPVPQDLTSLCSEVAISQTAGLKKCMKVCELGLCCTATDETSCYPEHSETCYLYTPCNNAYNLLYSD